MNYVLHPSSSRGSGSHGWLESSHSFSFAQYYDPQKMNFGLLRVLNDDKVAPARGFGTHPHDNMEIISIPLSGALIHRDDMGNSSVINAGDVQVMSAGTGVRHSEFNHSKEEWVNFLQLWIFPEQQDIPPRYHQKTFSAQDRINQWQVLVSPSEKTGVPINQKAFISRTDLELGSTLSYEVNIPGNGVYLFVLEGKIEVGEHTLDARDAIGLWEFDSIELKAGEDSQVLAIEVPMS